MHNCSNDRSNLHSILTDRAVRPVFISVGTPGILLNFAALFVVILDRQLRRRHRSTMILFAFNNLQILVVLFVPYLESKTFEKVIPYLIKFVNTGYNMTISGIILERLVLIHKCLHFGPRILWENKQWKTMLLIAFGLTLNMMLTVLVESILPVTLSFTILILILYGTLLYKISSLMKKSSIARRLLKGTARNYITAMLILFAFFSLSRDIAAPLFSKVKGPCLNIAPWMKPIPTFHSLHWIFDPVVYFFYHKAPRQTCKKMFLLTCRRLKNTRHHLDVFFIVHCPCDCPIKLNRRTVKVRPEDEIFYINGVVISNNNSNSRQINGT